MRWLLLLLLLQGCTWKTFAPTILGGAGAAGGAALGGIPGAVAGGSLGAGAGQIVKATDENPKMVGTIKNISEGDVQALIASAANEQKSWFDEVISGIYDLLILCGVGAALWFLVPIAYSRYLHKKTDEKINGRDTG